MSVKRAECLVLSVEYDECEECRVSSMCRVL